VIPSTFTWGEKGSAHLADDLIDQRLDDGPIGILALVLPIQTSHDGVERGAGLFR
jgi:hypothetical protein